MKNNSFFFENNLEVLFWRGRFPPVAGSNSQNMKIIDHLLVKFNSLTFGEIILYPIAVVTFVYAYKIVTIVLE